MAEMSENQLAAELAGLRSDFRKEIEKVNGRLDAMEKHSVSKSDVFGAVLTSQAVFYAGAAFVIILLNAVGVFD